MKIEHIALWTSDIGRSKEFYEKYFLFTAGDKYRNAKTGFESFFLALGTGPRLELMHMDHIPENLGGFKERHIGLVHFAVSVGSRDKVLEITEKLRKDGFVVAGEPRDTGDGYFESCVLDPDGNRIEITI